MPEPLTIYVCPACGSPDVERTRCESLPDHDRRRAAVLVFREEDVRPLWRIARELRDHLDAYSADFPLDVHHATVVDFSHAVDALPAPEEWKR